MAARPNTERSSKRTKYGWRYFASRELPCIESGDRQNAALTVEPGRPEHRRVTDLIDLDACGRNSRRLTFRPGGNSPQRIITASGLAVVPADGGHVLLRCDVESCREFHHVRAGMNSRSAVIWSGRDVTLTHGLRVRPQRAQKCD